MADGIPHSRAPLSASLASLLTQDDKEISFNEILRRTSGRGIYLVIIFLCLPFTTPIPLPGVSSVIGIVVMLLALRLAFGQSTMLPRWLGGRALSADLARKVLRAALKFVGMLERCIKPRGSGWVSASPWRTFHLLLIAFLSALLLLPLPVIFTNTLPGYAIIFVAASLLEDDGRIIWAGYLVAIIAVAYFAIIFVGSAEIIQHATHFVVQWVRNLLSP